MMIDAYRYAVVKAAVGYRVTRVQPVQDRLTKSATDQPRPAGRLDVRV